MAYNVLNTSILNTRSMVFSYMYSPPAQLSQQYQAICALFPLFFPNLQLCVFRKNYVMYIQV